MVVVAFGHPNDGAPDDLSTIQNGDLIALIDLGIGRVGKSVGPVDGAGFEGEDAEVLLVVDLFSDSGGVSGAVAREDGSFGMAALVNGAGEVEASIVIEVEEGAVEALVVKGLVFWNFSVRSFRVGARGEKHHEENSNDFHG